jgi:hypothetical protein
MLKMRMSVMELGKFTGRGGSAGQSESCSIILHGEGERNGTKLLCGPHKYAAW